MPDPVPPSPIAADDLLDSAFAAIDSGRLADAETACREILAREPTHFDALVMLGTLAGQTGRSAEGIDLIRRALAVEPDSVDAHLQLATLFQRESRAAEAIDVLEAAVGLEPDNATAQHDLGALYLRAGRLEEAAACFARAIALDPDIAPAHSHLGMVLELQGDEVRAASSYRRAAALDPELADAHARLGGVLLTQGKTAAAMDCFRRAVALSPDSELGQLSAVRLLFEQDKLAEAEALAVRALALHPESSNLYYILGNIMRRLGRFDEARESFDRAVRLNPGHAAAYFDLVSSKTLTEAERPLVARIERMLEALGIGEARQCRLHFALGKAYDDLTEYEDAIHHYDEANRLKNRDRRLDRASLTHIVDRTIASFTPGFFARVRGAGSESELPVLVLGMPRSGTTLVEQIISSHPDAAGGDELAFWHEAMADLRRSHSRGIDTAFMRRTADDYLTLLRSIAPSANRVTDKMPDNFRRIGLIHAVFPKARIVHCRRHPVDTALSVYFNNFNQGNEFAYDRANIVFYYEQYLRLMSHWRSVLPPDRFIEIDYEDLIADREAGTRRLIAFCGLDWNDACLRHESNKRTLKTASVWQARQPLYASSVERWRNYEPWLGEFRSLLPR